MRSIEVFCAIKFKHEPIGQYKTDFWSILVKYKYFYRYSTRKVYNL